MYDADAIEAINFEQLATATDRLLVRGGRVSKRRPSTPSLVHGSQPRPVAGTVAAQRSDALHFERTTIIRPASSHVQVFAITVVIPTLVGITAGLAALL
jgi:hypothetical protein